jgi:acyl-CoA synthetase (AMP-forming)/AMP-acid ligase II
MINASGYKVWPSEVELMLFKCPGVFEACVVGARDEYRGETVKAYIVLRDDAKTATSAEDIIAWSRRHMAAYKVPRRVEFVEGLPKSSSGKVLWRELQERRRIAAAGRRSLTSNRTQRWQQNLNLKSDVSCFERLCWKKTHGSKLKFEN